METNIAKNVIGDYPISREIEKFGEWTITFEKSHILSSKCTPPCTVGKLCLFCTYESELKIDHLPEMVFPYNRLLLEHKSGCAIEFNAFDALKHVCLTRDANLSVASAQTWRKAREESGLVGKTVGDFDWTFRSDYKGTYVGFPPGVESSVGIDTERLKQRDKILLFKELVLYEDELHDNGISLLNVRIRVMNWGFFILVRHFLRVDGVLLAVYDSRICHDFSTDYIIVEHSSRQGSIPELKLPLSVIKEPDEVTPLIPLIASSTEKYIIQGNEAL